MFGYAEDSFFTLGALGRIGLVALSLTLAAGMVWAVGKVAARLGWGLGLLGALVGMYLFVWLSPQIYYGYYLLIFEGLPLQWVVKSPPALGEFWQMLSFQGAATLSAHGQAVMFWLMVSAALWKGRIRAR